MKRAILLAALAWVLLAFPAAAQWQCPDHSVPIGRGSGTGFKCLAPGTSGLPLVSNGASSDPSYQSLPVFSSAASGAVPASGGGTVNFLRADGSWVSGGAGSVLNIAFSLHKNGTSQTGLTSGGYSTVTWSTAAFNTGGGTFASNKWTAPSAGYVYMNATIWCSANCLNTPNTGNPINVVKIIKNGTCGVSGSDVFAAVGSPALGGSPNGSSAQVSGVDLAAVGDQYSVCFWSDTTGGNATIDGNAAHTHWSGGYVNSGIPSPTGTLDVGSTVVTAGVTGRFLYDNGGALGEYPIGTGVATALGTNIGGAGAPVLFNGAGGTPSAINLTNGTALPIGGVTGLGTGCATWLATPSSTNLRGCINDETGTGLAYFQGGDAGTPSALVATNLSGTAASLTAGTFTAGSATNLTSGTLPPARTNGQMNGTATNDDACPTCVGYFVNAYGTNTGATVTISNASPGIITHAAHPYKAASPVNFTTTGGLPTGLTVGTNYWVCGGATLLTNSYAVATSVDNAIAGTCVNTSSSGSGTHTSVGNVILTSLSVFNIAGVSLTAGDWDVTASVAMAPGAGTTTSLVSGNIVTTTGGLGPLAATGSGSVRLDGWQGLSSSTGIPPPAFMVGPTRFSLSATTTIYLTTLATFVSGTNAAYGSIRARRVR